MIKLKSLAAASAVAAAVLSSPAAHADYVISSQGVTFTIVKVDADTFTLQIQNLLDGANGNWSTVTQIGALAFNNIGTGFSSLKITPPGSFAVDGGLNANGCNGAGANFYCFSFNPLIAATNNNLFTIDVFGANLNFGSDPSLGPELKVNFMNANGTQVGDLLSKRLPLSSSSSSTNTSGQVPEPGSSTLALLGLAMLGASFVLRRRQQRGE